MSCNICTEDYNKVTRGIVVCVYCDFTACRQCCSRYIVDRQEATCMNTDCTKEWSRRFLNENFTKKFFNTEWKAVQEKKCLEKERALFPATMATIEREREEAKARKEIKPLENEEKITQRKIKDLEQRLYHGDYTDEQIQHIHSEHAAVWIRHVDIRRRLQNLRVIQANGGDVASKATYNGRTCSDSNCRGLLSTQWKCATCEKYTCKECHLLKDDNHVCKVEDVETAKLLASDTKPCPKCRVPIHKIMGCDQMWCTQCHTGFSWKTGRIENKIHNPHFFEWQRQNANGTAPRTVGDVECGRDLGDSRALLSIRKLLRTSCGGLDITEKNIERVVRLTIHLEHSQGVRFRTDRLVNNQDLRIRYLDKSLTKKQFKSNILRRDKAYEKKQDIYNVIQLQVQSITDIIYRLENDLVGIDRTSSIGLLSLKQRTSDICNNYMIEIENVTTYCNKLFEEHAETYACKKYMFDYQFDRDIGSRRYNLMV